MNNTYIQFIIKNNRISRLFEKRLSHYLRRNRFNCTIIQVIILWFLQENGGRINQNTLRDILWGISTNNTYNLKMLQENGYIKSTRGDLSDKRFCDLELTDEGKLLCAKIQEHFDEEIKEMERAIDWTDEDSKNYLADLEILHSFLRVE